MIDTIWLLFRGRKESGVVTRGRPGRISSLAEAKKREGSGVLRGVSALEKK